VSEIEVKVLDIDPDRIRSMLAALGAVPAKKGREVNRMFDFPDERLWSSGCYLRLREFASKHVLTFKRRLPGTHYKTSEEIETEVSNGAAAAAIVEALGLVTRRIDEKDRESYRLGEIMFEIDTWPTVPPYLEIEAPTEALVEEGLRLLGISRDEKVTSERLDGILQRHYGRVVPPSLTFPRDGGRSGS
jgi:adenylate cyclase class 2